MPLLTLRQLKLSKSCEPVASQYLVHTFMEQPGIHVPSVSWLQKQIYLPQPATTTITTFIANNANWKSAPHSAFNQIYGSPTSRPICSRQTSKPGCRSAKKKQKHVRPLKLQSRPTCFMKKGGPTSYQRSTKPTSWQMYANRLPP